MHHGHKHTGSDLENYILIARLPEGRENVQKNPKGCSQVLSAHPMNCVSSWKDPSEGEGSREGS